MKKIFLFISFILCFFYCFSQPIINRTTGANTVNDPRLQGGFNLFIPRYVDTTAANIQKGVDSCGAIIFTYNTNGYWLRGCSPKRWIQVASGVISTSNIYNSNGTLTDLNRTLTGLGASSSMFFNDIGEFRISGADAFATTGLISTDGNGGTAYLGRLSDGVFFESGDSLKLNGVGQKTDITVNMPVVWNVLTNSLAYGDWSAVNADSLFGVKDNLFSANRVTNMQNFRLGLDSGNVVIKGSQLTKSDSILYVGVGGLAIMRADGNLQTLHVNSLSAPNFNFVASVLGASVRNGSSLQFNDNSYITAFQQNLPIIRSYPSVVSLRKNGLYLDNDTLGGKNPASLLDSTTYFPLQINYTSPGDNTSRVRAYIRGDGAAYLHLPYQATVDSVVGWKDGLLVSTLSSQFSGGSAVGNQGNIQINNGGAFGTPGSDSLTFTSSGLSLKGGATMTGDLNVGGNDITLNGATFVSNSASAAATRIFPQNNALQIFRSGAPTEVTVWNAAVDKAFAIGASGGITYAQSSGSDYMGFQATSTSRVGIGRNDPEDAKFVITDGSTSLHLMKFESHTIKTTPVAGGFDFNTDDLFFTITTGAARKRFLFADNSGGLTSGRVPFATTNGRLTDNSVFTFNGTNIGSIGIALTGNGTSSPGLSITGSYGGDVATINASGAIGIGSDGAIISSGGTLVEAGSGTHTNLSGAYFSTPTITGGAATVTDAQTVYIQGAPSATVSGRVWALRVASGETLIGGGQSFVPTVSAAGTLSLDHASVVYVASGTTTTWTLPAIAGTVGRYYIIKNRGSGAITLNSNAGGNEIYTTSAVNTTSIAAGASIQLVNDGTYFLVVD